MRFLYANTANIYPQDRHLIQGLSELGHTVVEIGKKEIKKEIKNYDALFIGFTSLLFVIHARLASPRAKIFFNAVLPQIDANIVSRREFGFLFYKIVKWWIVDFLSFHLASKVLLESKAQMDFVHKVFFVPTKKLTLSYSGLNEKEFFYDPAVKKDSRFTVLFRGRFLPESGILTVLEAAKKLEDSDIRFLIIGHGFMYKEFNAKLAKLAPKNVEHIHDRIQIDELRNIMLSAHVSLGQLAKHSRLDRTLPCKLFESLALKLPYLTGRNEAVFELLTENENCFAVEPGDADDLAQKIFYLKKNHELVTKIGDAGYALYQEKMMSKKLASDVMNSIYG